MKSTTSVSPSKEARTPERIESAPRLGPTVRSSWYSRGAGNAPERRVSARSSADCFENLALNERNGLHFVVEHYAHVLVNIGARPLAELLGPGILQRKVDLVFIS